MEYYDDDDELYHEDSDQQDEYDHDYPEEAYHSDEDVDDEIGSNEERTDPRMLMRDMLASLASGNNVQPNELFMRLLGGQQRAQGEGSRMHSLVANVENVQVDPFIAMESLRELSERLLMMNPMLADRAIPHVRLIHAIVDILNNYPDELELQLVCCRCLYNLFEVNPDYIPFAVGKGVVEALQSKLLEISFIDLAEQALQTLEFISRFRGTALVNALPAVLQYVDFFTIHAQRQCATICANACKNITDEHLHVIMGVLPMLKQVLCGSDAQIVEFAVTAMLGIVSGLRENLEMIVDDDMLVKFNSMLSDDTQLNTKLKVLQVVSLVAVSSESLSHSMIEHNVESALVQCLDRYKKTSQMKTNEALMFVPNSLLVGITKFIMLLLPTEEEQFLTATQAKDAPQHESYLGFVHTIFPLLLEIFTNSVDYEIRRVVLVSAARIVSSLNHEQIDSLPSITGLLASVVSQNKAGNDDKVPLTLLLAALALVSSLIAKNPEKFVVEFQREGILDIISSIPQVFQVESLSNDVDDEAEDEDDEDEGYLSDESLPPVPRSTNITIFKELTPRQLGYEIVGLAKSLVNVFDSADTGTSQYIQSLKEISEQLEADVQRSSDAWTELWMNLKHNLFNDQFHVSSYELISTGIVNSLCKAFDRECFNKQFTSTFKSVFSECELIDILQTTLNRTESFEIVETGLSKAVSLGKQVKLKLCRDDGDEDDDENMKEMIVIVHSIASYRSLGEFLKHRSMRVAMFTNQTTSADWHYEFKIGGTDVPLDSTVFGSIFHQNKNIWNAVHSVEYYKVSGDAPQGEVLSMYPEKPMVDSKPGVVLLRLLKHLHDHVYGVEYKENFLNSKLSAKLMRQLEEPLIVASGVLPDWCVYGTRNFPFMFPLETRLFFLQSTSFGYSRLIQLWQQRTTSSSRANDDIEEQNAAEDLSQLGRPKRRKMRIQRQVILQSAVKILDGWASDPSILEIEYQDEEGTGLGPTLEFYSSVSHLLRSNELLMWRSSTDEEFVEGNLFPAPLSTNVTWFKTLGKFIARALLDSRILDFCFHPYFFTLASRYALGEQPASDPAELMAELHSIDPALHKSLEYIAHNNVDELNIPFTLPGYELELCENGAGLYVTNENRNEFVKLVLDFTLGSRIQPQIQAFVDGFSTVFPYHTMCIFSPQELVDLTGNVEEDWSPETLVSCIQADHGYTMGSPMISSLIELMASLSVNERRLFLQFLTGSPKLPMGGFAKLKPKLTVVVKHPEEGHVPDSYLPSVMTCANYLKLPNYSSAAVLRSRILQAITDGSGAFLLS